MPITSFAGSSFTVSVEATAYTAQITRGGVSSTPNIVTTKTLGPNKAVTQTDVEDTASFDFLYDADTGFYGALWTASRTGASLTVLITGGAAEWTGEMTVTDLSVEFTAEDAATCSASFTATGDPLDFDAS
jgi:hypothetical protein